MFSKKSLLIVTILTIFSIFLLLNCSDDNPVEPTNEPPKIQSISVLNESGANLSPAQFNNIKANIQLTLKVNATDDNQGDVLSYMWSVNVGSLNKTDSSVVTWSTPNSNTKAVVIIQVTDGEAKVYDTLNFDIYKDASLSNGQVSPSGGITTETYSYTVTFTDPLNNAPNNAFIMVDGSEHELNKVSGTFLTGAVYQYQTTLSDGSHTYRFHLKDHKNNNLFYPANGYGTGPILTADTAILHSDNVIMVDEQDSLSLSSVAGATFTYSYTGLPPSIEAGDVVMSIDTGGYLRKVTSVNIFGNQIKVNTVQASLADAFDKISFDTTLTLSLNNSMLNKTKSWGKQPFLASGVQISDGKLVLDDITLFDGNINGQPASVKISSASFDFEPELKVGWDIGLFNKEVHAIATGTSYLSMTPEIVASAGFIKNDEIRVAYLPIPVEWAGIPAEITFSLYAGYEINTNVAGRVTFNMSGQTDITVGGRYENGAFKEVWSANPSWSTNPPIWGADSNASIKIYLRPQISIKILHVAGPYLDVAPYLDLEGEVTTNPLCWEYGVYAGLEANAGLELDIFITSKNFNIPLFDTRLKLTGDQDCPGLDSQQVTIQPGPDQGKDAFIEYTLWPDGSETYRSFDTTFLEAWIEYAGSHGIEEEILIQFPLSQIPANSEILSAKLMLYGYGTSNYVRDPTFKIKEINSSWDESTVSWDSKPLYGNEVSRITLPFGTSWHEWTITSLVQEWVNGKSNYGVAILCTSNEDQGAFKSSDYSDASKRPILEVIYR